MSQAQIQEKIRNVAIIAHVDHGKTTLVDQIFRQCGVFRDNQVVEDRLMDSMDLERERGITIMAKNGACQYKDHTINIIDTPGHADFGGEVERVLQMADGALFLVDAKEGPMPQSLFVLKKAIARNIPVIVVVNKIDKPDSRCDWVVDQVFDLLVKLHAPDHILDFPVVYASAKNGFAVNDPTESSHNVFPVLDRIISYIPAPAGNANDPVQLLVSSLSYSVFMGRLAIGKLTSGSLKVNQEVICYQGDQRLTTGRISKIYKFEVNKQIEVPSASCGDIIAISGFEEIKVGQTVTDSINPKPLPASLVDPPTISMNFLPNDSPFSGLEGKFVTSRHLRDRLYRETLSDVALQVSDLSHDSGFKVSGRGELHLSIFIEKMRREGYEFQVSKPTVIYREDENRKKLEPFEELTIDVEETLMGKVIETLGPRKGQLIEVNQHGGMARLTYRIPTRGLLGYQNEFMTETKGMGVMNYVFFGYAPYAGDIKMRQNGVLISKETCTTVAYGLDNLQDRGKLFLGPAEKVYEGQIIGEHCRDEDLIVNPSKSKKLTNMRSVSADAAIILTPPTMMTLEQCIAYIADDELVEVTPKSIRLRKTFLSENARKQASKNY